MMDARAYFCPTLTRSFTHNIQSFRALKLYEVVFFTCSALTGGRGMEGSETFQGFGAWGGNVLGLKWMKIATIQGKPCVLRAFRAPDLKENQKPFVYGEKLAFIKDKLWLD